MRHEIIGTTMPVLNIGLDSGERVVAVSGELSWMTSSIQMNTSTSAGGGGGGLFGALKRVVGGGSLFMTEYRAEGAAGTVSFATKLPGHIQPVEVAAGRTYMIHRHGFLCGTSGVELGAGFQQSLGAGVFGGNGFVLQKMSGTGTAWIELGGEIVTYDLAAGETMRVHPGHVGMFEDTVKFEITRIKGIANMLFGGDGIFLAALTGPGRIWLQTLTVSNLAHAIIPFIPAKGG
ncbi:MAG: TIGR00266 family protein [Chthoniobacter sp.]|nr:TIGR00266 family protein [Chthoniobacter sp.]